MTLSPGRQAGAGAADLRSAGHLLRTAHRLAHCAAMLVVTGTVTARPDTFQALREAALAHTARSRTEPGCLRHSVHVDCEDPLTLFFYEEWADRPALDTHFAQPGSHAFMAAVRELAAKSTGVKILPIVER